VPQWFDTLLLPILVSASTLQDVVSGVTQDLAMAI